MYEPLWQICFQTHLSHSFTNIKNVDQDNDCKKIMQILKHPLQICLVFLVKASKRVHYMDQHITGSVALLFWLRTTIPDKSKHSICVILYFMWSGTTVPGYTFICTHLELAHYLYTLTAALCRIWGGTLELCVNETEWCCERRGKNIPLSIPYIILCISIRFPLRHFFFKLKSPKRCSLSS